MALKVVCQLEEISLEELFKDLKIFTLAYRSAKGKRAWQKPDKGSPAELRRMKAKERELNKHLMQKLVPAAKTLPYFTPSNCEPKEVHFCELAENVLGEHHGFGSIGLNRGRYDDTIMPSALSHELAHILGGFGLFGDESLVTLLGWEIDARMALAGDKRHRVSLCRSIRDVLLHVSYLKAKSLGQIDEWKGFIRELFGDEFPEEKIEENIKYLEDGRAGIFSKLSDYAVPPYLAVKGAVRATTACVLDEYKDWYSWEVKTRMIEIPALMQIWNTLITQSRP